MKLNLEEKKKRNTWSGPWDDIDGGLKNEGLAAHHKTRTPVNEGDNPELRIPIYTVQKWAPNKHPKIQILSLIKLVHSTKAQNIQHISVGQNTTCPRD